MRKFRWKCSLINFNWTFKDVLEISQAFEATVCKSIRLILNQVDKCIIIRVRMTYCFHIIPFCDKCCQMGDISIVCPSNRSYRNQQQSYGHKLVTVNEVSECHQKSHSRSITSSQNSPMTPLMTKSHLNSQSMSPELLRRLVVNQTFSRSSGRFVLSMNDRDI